MIKGGLSLSAAARAEAARTGVSKRRRLSAAM